MVQPLVDSQTTTTRDEQEQDVESDSTANNPVEGLTEGDNTAPIPVETGSDGEEPAGRPGRSRRWRRVLVWAAAALVIVPLIVVGWSAVSLSMAWSNLDRTAYDGEALEALAPVEFSADDLVAEDLPAEAAAVLTAADPGASADQVDPVGTPGPDGLQGLSLDDRYTTYMVVGSDEGDARADVILLVLLPVDGSAPIMVSLPRDLYLPNRCTQGLTRINAAYNGCGAEVNGATLLSGMVQDFTGLEVDHFALFTMDGFEAVIDAVGGMEICLEYPAREIDKFELPAGCTVADGETVLGWVRSRKTQELVDGRWRTMPGVNDLTRNQRQQDLILALSGELASFDSPRELTRFVTSLSDTFVLDDRLSLGDAVDLAWTHRDVRPGDVRRVTIPVQPHETRAGAQVLLPTASFAEVLASAG